MNSSMQFSTLAAVLPLAFALSVAAADLPPGQIDFGEFTPPSGGEFVEVNIPGSLIALGAKFVEKEEPDVAKLINGIKQVRVNVIGLNDDNREDLQKRAQKVRNDLAKKGWERIVMAQKEQQDVGVYLKMDNKSAVQGLAVVVLEGNKQAVFVNIVGDIRPEQLSMLGERLHIDPLKNLNPESSK
jgi:hypothetical protein